MELVEMAGMQQLSRFAVTEVMVRLGLEERERGLHSITGLQIAWRLWICQQKYSEGDENTLWARPITVHNCRQRGDTKVQLGRAPGGRRTWVATAREPQGLTESNPARREAGGGWQTEDRAGGNEEPEASEDNRG